MLVGLTLSVVELTPEMFPAAALLQVAPPSLETCHWIAAAEQFAGAVPSLTLKLASAGSVTVCPAGCSAIAGAPSHLPLLTVSVAAWLVVSPWAFVSTTRN